ncbi:NmrA-like family protein [Penicillium canescens]|uniref:NmrA-like family protein n=1 Tax=Penicillium canescens TaxID=5083 RepID=A0AAD6N6F9_PENCN|nr:NmrA-like family protein [Penicillium canescens]KAJ6035395.1 NmrA-like family protein [Penicillium canescens]KAJ6037522.1 NmrA-like family protein [Penicillium canescens]KAJ6054143.1 NmrA-like family protein [Penicillium canescens]
MGSDSSSLRPPSRNRGHPVLPPTYPGRQRPSSGCDQTVVDRNKSSSRFDHLPWYAYTADIRQYLADLNKDKKVPEYTFFQPGLFTNYFTRPYKSSEHIYQLETLSTLKLNSRDDTPITLTAAQDLAAVVAKAIEYEGEWPVTSGIRSTRLSIGELIELGGKFLGGMPFTIDQVKAEDFESGEWQTSWLPEVDRPSIRKE